MKNRKIEKSKLPRADTVTRETSIFALPNFLPWAPNFPKWRQTKNQNLKTEVSVVTMTVASVSHGVRRALLINAALFNQTTTNGAVRRELVIPIQLKSSIRSLHLSWLQVEAFFPDLEFRPGFLPWQNPRAFREPFRGD